MYEKFFGLRERPFDLTPNPRFMYFTPRHREALVNLQFGIESRKGVVVLIGEAGMGKTTVIRAAIETQRTNEVRCVYLNNPLLTRGEFIEFLANALQLSTAAERSKTRLVAELASRLTEERQRGATVVLLIDEAQSLSNELLEELRMLTNIETHSEKLVTLVLVGQPQLAERLNDERLGQLKQRIELRCTLSPFELAETVMYIRNRVRIAGGDAVQMFTRDAIQVIHERSRGIPRSISVICENALVGAFAENQKPVTRALVQEVCDEFDLSPETPREDYDAAPSVPASPTLPGIEPTTATMNVGPVATPAQPPSNGNGNEYRDGSSSVSIPTGRRWWSFSTAGRRS
jgi:type II secretory pathway predicted ATPase ExeA